MSTNAWQEEWNEFLGYRRWWVTALRELLGWSEDRTLKWSRTWEEFVLQDPPSTFGTFLHWAPANYILPLLMPRSLRRRIDRGEINMSSVDTDLQDAIENRQGLRCYSDPEYDWPAARARVEAALVEYGERLPGPDDRPEDMDKDWATDEGSQNGDTASSGGSGPEKTEPEGGNEKDGPGSANE